MEEFQALVYSVPRRLGLSGADAEDVFQATFLALFRGLDRIEDARTLPRWLAVTASRESYRLIRVNSKTTASDDLEAILADEEAGADREAERSLEAESLHRALDVLGGKCKDLLSALYLDEAAYDEISARLKMPIGAIGPTRGRCLEKLRKIMGV